MGEYADEYQAGILAATEKCANTPTIDDMSEEARLLTEDVTEVVTDVEEVESSTATIESNEWITPEDLMEYRGVTLGLVNNFTCVMKELSFLTEDGEINSDIFAYSEELSYADQVHFTSGNKAGSDPVFMKKYGRMAIYFKCIKDVERNLCAKYLLTRAFERFEVPIDTTGFEDKYDAALFVAGAMDQASTQTEKHIDDYFWGEFYL